MRPLLVLWLGQHGLPPWLAPSYFVLVGISALVACIVVLRLAQEDGADLKIEARTLLFAYVGALLGGYVFEAVRAIPEGLASGSFAPLLRAGRAAYGGLLMATGCAALYRLHHRAPLGPFFDRSSLLLGIIYLAVRGGCFLAGCDYGIPTALPLGVRYPPGTLAAMEHAARGFVPYSAPSLPTHPTQLYEGFWALLASAVAAFLFRRGARDGSVFAVWVALYSVGRFLIEFLRGDKTRGLYQGLSSAQYVSMGLCLLVALFFLYRAHSHASSNSDRHGAGTDDERLQTEGAFR